jgi:hypothetical protein
MWVTLALLAVSQLPPGPLDAFRNNYASIKVALDFDYSEGNFNEGSGRLWSGGQPAYVENPKRRIVGDWKCDGQAEYFRFSSPEEVLDQASKDVVKQEAGKAYFNVPFTPKTEAIWDGAVLCGHSENPHRRRTGGDADWNVLSAQVPDEPLLDILGTARGPFHWGFCFFPQILKHYAGTTPSRRGADRWGHPTEVEVYRKDAPDGSKNWDQLEVSYDPSIGYLPRFVRGFSCFDAADQLSVDEVYLIEARPCAAGGFVPTEWYNVSFMVDGFRRRFPKYDDTTDFNVRAAQLGVSHFRASRVTDFKGTVALVDIGGVHSIGTIGGMVSLRSRRASLTIDDVKRTVGERLTTPQRKLLPSIDEAELREYDRPARNWGRAWFLAAVVLVVLYVVLWNRRRRARAGLLALVAAALYNLPGCGTVGPPVVKVTGAFQQNVVPIEPTTYDLPMTLVVRNDGNQTLRVFRVDGGCSCRKVDEGSLPVDLKPGQSHGLSVRLSITPATQPHHSPFTLQTDKGVLGIGPMFFALVSDEFEPADVAAPYLSETDDWTFDFKYRGIRRADSPSPRPEVKFPDEFTVTKAGSKSGAVAAAADYTYEEDTYVLTLKDRALGGHRSAITLVSPQGQVLREAKVDWKRVPFLSSVPDRLILGRHPVRAFLRCPDESVELTKVLSIPAGVKAVVSSARALTVTLADNAPGIVDGIVEVGTTDQRRPPLRVQVVRYDLATKKTGG